MCVGSMCNGDPLPQQTYLRYTNVAGQPIVVTVQDTTAVFLVTGNGFAKVHNCPSCNCVSVKA